MAQQILRIDKDLNLDNREDYTKFIRFARVLKVYDADTLANKDNYGTVELMWLDTGDNINGTVSYLKAGYSVIYGSGIIVVPNVGDIAACYVVQGGPPIIVGFFSRNQFEAAVNPDKSGFTEFGTIRPLYAGEILIKGRSQSEIYLKNDGTVNIKVQDGTNTSTTSSNEVTKNSEQIFSRADASALNTQVEVVLGVDSDAAGNKSGASKEVFRIESASTFANSVALRAQKNQRTFFLPVASDSEITEVTKVELCSASNSGTLSVVKSITAGFELKTQYKYLPEEVGDNGVSKDPCTLDFNSSFAYVTLPAVAAGYVTSSTMVRVFFNAKRRSVRVSANTMGDLFLDARNIVMRSKNSGSYLGLFGNGDVRLGGSNIEIGDRLKGHIKLDQAGIELSPGNGPQSTVHTVERKDLLQATGYKTLFYINDDYPPFIFDAEQELYTICTRQEYNSLSNAEKCNILPRNFDPLGTPGGFTESTMNALLANYLVDNGVEATSYGEMKTL